MTSIEDRLKVLGYSLPPAFVFPKKNRRGCVRVNNMLYLSGHGLDLPLLEGVRQTGRFGENITEAEGYATARAVMLTMLATVKAEVGSLDRIKQIVRIFGMCNASPEFDPRADPRPFRPYPKPRLRPRRWRSRGGPTIR